MQQRSLSGTYECSLDSRFRMAIPARFRGPFLDGAMLGWWIDPCLIIAPPDYWTALMKQIFGTMTVLDDEARELRRFLTAGVYHQELDAQGRVSLAPELRDYAGITGKKVKVVGAEDYLEVWDPDTLAGRFSHLKDEGVAARAQRLADRLA